MTLYEIEEVYRGLMEYAEENEGDITEVVEEFEKVRADFDNKAENYWRIIKNLNAQADALKAEKQKLEQKQRRAERLADSLKERMANAMQTFEKDKVKTQFGSFSFRKSTSVEILDETVIPDDFFRVKKEVQKSVIADAIKAGHVVPGAALKENRNLQVR